MYRHQLAAVKLVSELPVLKDMGNADMLTAQGAEQWAC